jgi:hypothetical protein
LELSEAGESTFIAKRTHLTDLFSTNVAQGKIEVEAEILLKIEREFHMIGSAVTIDNHNWQ